MKKTRMHVISFKKLINNFFIALFFISGFMLGGFLSQYFVKTPFLMSACAAIDFTDGTKKDVFSFFVDGFNIYDLGISAMPKGNVKSSVAINDDYAEKDKIAATHQEPLDTEEISITASTASGYTPTNGLYVQNDSGYSFDMEKLLNKDINLQKADPMVLILHTHTSEAYTPTENFSYVPTDPYRTEDPNLNVVHVGGKLAEVLKEQGIGVVHDITNHDYPSYSGSYNRALETIQKNLENYPSIQIVIDLHRDAISNTEGTKYYKTVAAVGGTKTAQALIVIGTDSGGLPHPNWQNNLSLGLKMQSYISKKYSSLARPLHLREERFNGHALDGAVLLEIGSNGNTMEEALLCAEYVGLSIADMINTEAK